MKKVVSILMAVILLSTMLYIPSVNISYATTDKDDGAEYIGDLSDAVVSVDSVEMEYTGEYLYPEGIKVMYRDETLENEIDYVLNFDNNKNPGEAIMTVTGIGAYTGTQRVSFTIKAADNSKYLVSLVGNNFTYLGKEIKPSVIVKYKDVELKKDEDYIVKYSNNIMPGVAKVEVLINGSNTSITKEFYISKIKTFKAESINTNSIKLKWARMYNVTGYKVYTYNFQKKKWQCTTTIKGNNNTSYTITGLGAGYGYQYKVLPYVKKGTKVYYGVFSDVLSVPTRPDKVVLNSIKTTPKLSLTANWSKRQGSGYQMLLSKSSKFSSYSSYDINSYNKTSQTITNLADDVTYYVKIRAYRTYGSIKVYGKWSNVKSIKTKDSGWYEAGGKKFYYANGKKALGSWKISGDKYYFDTNTGELLGASKTMWDKVNNKANYSDTPWLLVVSRDLNRTCVYKRINGKWVMKYYWKCTTGAKGTRTPTGSFKVPSTKTKLNFFGLNKDYTCWYATRITKSIYFHSVLYFPFSKTNMQDGRLGYNLSHGCIRLSIDNAKWIHKNIDAGTRVVIY